MSLEPYRRKRQFGRTPEPRGRGAGAGKKAAARKNQETARHKPHKRLSFVVQEHHASHLHYDFRLELGGVLKSWAVPKGPSMNPREHHLAIHVEDHPYAYRTFEGTIPPGNYGAGEVRIWDHGWYEARKGDPADAEHTLRHELANGHLTFILHGKKLRGEFALIRMPHADDENAWLLVKKDDEFAKHTGSSTVAASASHEFVNHSPAAIRAAHNGQGAARSSAATSDVIMPDLSRCPRRAKPWTVDPMLCTLVDEPFNRDGWLFEIKWDGYRAIGSKKGAAVALYSRAHTDFSAAYQPIADALRRLGHDVIVDGEVVVADERGQPHFEWLQNWRREPHGILQYYVFDILWCDGRDVRALPLAERKQLLKAVLPGDSASPLRYSDDLPAEGEKLFREMQRRGLEGMVAKNGQSPYREGQRGADWLKIKTHLRQEVVIGGYTEPRGTRQFLGSLIVGVYDDNGKLIYAGHSGGGIPDEQRRQLRDRLQRLERRISPFASPPKPNAPVHWVRPQLVCEMSFGEWTADGRMRQPEFKGLREDKNPRDVHRERSKPSRQTAARSVPARSASTPDAQKAVPPASLIPIKPATAGIAGLPFEFTHADKVFFPRHGYTKGDILRYYEQAAEFILPYLRGRPCSLNRMPGGITGESFFQKNNEHLPEWVPSASIFSDANHGDLRWIVCDSFAALAYMVQLGCVEINPWNARVSHLDNPDWTVIDLDPEGVGFETVTKVAREVKRVCDEWGIATFPKTSGKTGLHIYIPLEARYTFEQAKNLAHLIVLEVNKRMPTVTSVERMPAKRRRKVYLDYLQNRAGQTLAAPYSLRPTPAATVSMPLHWDEVTLRLRPTDFTIKNALARLRRAGDLWRPLLHEHIDLAAVLKKAQNQTD